MWRIKMYAKFTWICATSMFLPTAIITPRIQRALEELEREKRRAGCSSAF